MDKNIAQMMFKMVKNSLDVISIGECEYATINSINPLTIKLENNQILSIEFFEFTTDTIFLKKSINMNNINTKLLIYKFLGNSKFIILNTIDSIGNSSIAEIISILPLTIKLENDSIIDEEFLKYSNTSILLKGTTDVTVIGKKVILQKHTLTDSFIIMDFFGG